MNVSVVCTTYNHPRWLEKVIWGYAEQSHREFELVIADDGSTGETRHVINELRGQVNFEIIHVWQKDIGFRKCQALNKAIAATNYDYLVFTDGDCIPRNDFLATHVRLSRKNCFLSGGCVRLPIGISRLLSHEDVRQGRATNISWLRSQGMPSVPKLRMLTRSRVLAYVMDSVSTTQASFNGHNTSVWKQDVIRVNGFDERMQYGGLDRELGERLLNAGMMGVRIRHRAVCVHLDHHRPYKDTDLVAKNRSIRRHTLKSGHAWAPQGLDQHLKCDTEQPALRAS